MTRLAFAPRALAVLERLTDFLLQDPALAQATSQLLVGGLRILQQHPLVGRIAEHGLRELVISRGRSGYIALYRYDVVRDVALVLAVRHQREGGFAA
ncbi:MAG: type II toxin-antitoxin system RelE/ParE family toxin [Nitrosomonadales bacterium]|nr:type II toxin-antitoxin system RelE/ParE family toxin [Nitrosomonadales bacterium]